MDYVIVIVLLVVLVLLLVLSYFRKKKYNQEVEKMQNEVKKNDKIMTYSGILGTVVDIFEEEGVKQLVIKTGHKNNFGYIQIDIKAVYGVVGLKDDAKVEKTEKVEKVETIEETAVKSPETISAPKTTKNTTGTKTKTSK